jgi:hypothetical protein
MQTFSKRFAVAGVPENNRSLKNPAGNGAGGLPGCQMYEDKKENKLLYYREYHYNKCCNKGDNH